MNTAQWIFHYKEIKVHKKRTEEIEKLKLDIILDRLDLIALATNPEMVSKILDEANTKKKNKANTNEDSESVGDDLLDFWESIKNETPEKLTVFVGKSKEEKYFLPKYKRKRNIGIDIKDGGDNNGNGTISKG